MAPKHPSAPPAGGDMPKRARKTYTLEEKLEVLDRAEKGQRNCYSGRIGRERSHGKVHKTQRNEDPRIS
ncbi:hypothetical protein E2C01_025109 [Portunus trituberculatus]|uniref:Transposase n=1 Tax=Portunus trituberculatus TaxID=210409 RepID=A0A5B7ECA6_PORTR|nr:hypothetical protein [Portunus trituberculatus]